LEPMERLERTFASRSTALLRSKRFERLERRRRAD
jgi:hypothetical protein